MNLVLNQSGKTISGSDVLKEIVGVNTYTISPKSFWQSHINAPRLLLQKVIEYADIKMGDKVCDLYGWCRSFYMLQLQN